MIRRCSYLLWFHARWNPPQPEEKTPKPQDECCDWKGFRLGIDGNLVGIFWQEEFEWA